MLKKALKKFEGVWSAWSRPYPFNFLKAVFRTWSILEYFVPFIMPLLIFSKYFFGQSFFLFKEDLLFLIGHLRKKKKDLIQSNLYKTTTLGTTRKWLFWTGNCLEKHLHKTTTNQMWLFWVGFWFFPPEWTSFSE